MSSIPLPYQLFFLWIEPFSTILGAFFAWFQPVYYLELLHAKSAPGILGLPLSTNVALRQLGNMYLAFTLNEALVLRATTDLKVWRVFLLCLLVADFGHLYSCFPLGISYYYDVANWNSAAWGNIAFVYCGAALRTCFLLGVGLPGAKSRVGGPRTTRAKPRKSIKADADEVIAVTPTQLSKTPAQSTRRRKTRAEA